MKSMELSIIIPTYNEGINVLNLAERIEQVLNDKIIYEIIFIDDSSDDTPIYLDQLSRRNQSFRYVHRTNQQGLSSAIVEGFHQAKSTFLIIMDGDLQHPPEVIPHIIKMLKKGYEVVIPSRFIKGGGEDGLSIPRKLISWTARLIAKIALRRVRSIKDPTSGFFAVKRSVIKECDFQSRGWKILLETIVKGDYLYLIEIPYGFEPRKVGNSKMHFIQQLDYLYLITKLVISEPKDRKFWLAIFSAVACICISIAFYMILL
ncbi:glycosyl transferase [Bacillus cereus]|uniref:polyprenol monophosphomannose synthase n=1 Tax=Bacillus cereus TaxID=1396 RepID=UPI000BFBF26D|nr:polyprenol monophosphomannose synthase [Bacillus cereus]PGU00841.1 glycosyl transferase [Bacillus cereus]